MVSNCVTNLLCKPQLQPDQLISTVYLCRVLAKSSIVISGCCTDSPVFTMWMKSMHMITINYVHIHQHCIQKFSFVIFFCFGIFKQEICHILSHMWPSSNSPPPTFYVHCKHPNNNTLIQSEVMYLTTVHVHSQYQLTVYVSAKSCNLDNAWFTKHNVYSLCKHTLGLIVKCGW